MQHCARDIRDGRISSVADIERIWALGSQITALPGEHFVNHGAPLNQSDAELVWDRSTPQAWVLDDAEIRGLTRFNELFAGKLDALDPGIPLDFLESQDGRPNRLTRAQNWVIQTLGLTDHPYGYTLDHLAQLAQARLGLHNEIMRIASGQATEEQPRIFVADQSAARALPAAEAASARAPLQRMKSNIRNGEMEPLTGVSREIRTHRRPERRRHRLGIAIAAGAIAIIGALAPVVLSHGKSQPSVPNTGPVEPAPAAVQPAQELPNPDMVERILPIGNYDQETRTGAIWFTVEDYATELGHPNLTLLQIHTLTQKTLDYMNTRVPGGMNWSKAREIPTGAQLPYPPANTMRQWIGEVTSQVAV